MKPINVYILTRIRKNYLYTPYTRILAQRTDKSSVKQYEFESLCALVDKFSDRGIGIDDWEGFYYGYSIKRIGKEFDLLKICREKEVLNIELKSQKVHPDKMKKQLLRNKYYLQHLAPVIRQFTYVYETDEIYTLDQDELVLCDEQELIRQIKAFKKFETGDIHQLFRPSDFLISPLNTPNKFLHNEYFLTQQQEDIKKSILSDISRGCKLFGITGSAGTGKTLLIYDIARECSVYDSCLMIHNGILSEEHVYLDHLLSNIDIISAKEMKASVLRRYRYIIVDETQRMFPDQLEMILSLSRTNKTICIFSYDYFQTLSWEEEVHNTPAQLNEIEDFTEFRLTGRIRSDTEMISFMNILFQLDHRSEKRMDFPNIDVLWASNDFEAGQIIQYYQLKKDYVFLDYMKATHRKQYTKQGENKIDIHNVIGQEFDHVIITMDKNFRYSDEDVLQDGQHPNYIYYKLVYQAVSRVRERLCIVVVDNERLFEKILSIKNS